jgi:hypothetical protein
MTNTRYFSEQQIRIDRYRALQREVTDPLAARLLHDIISNLEATARNPQTDVPCPHPDGHRGKA